MKGHETLLAVSPDDTNLYSISQTGALTGVNPVTLRAWERRYGLLRPRRTEKGHRLYSETDIEQIRTVLDWLAKGVAISRIRPLLNADVFQGDASPAAEWELAQEEGIHAALTLAPRKLEQQFNRLSGDYPLAQVFSQWVVPLHAHLTLLAQDGDHPGYQAAAGVLHQFLRTKLSARLLAAIRRDGRAPRWLLLPVGEADPLAGLQLAALCADAGVPCLPLPSPLRAEELRLLGHRQDVAGLLLWLAPDLTATSVRRALGATPRQLPTRLFACGPGLLTTRQLPDGVTPLMGDDASVVAALPGLGSAGVRSVG